MAFLAELTKQPFDIIDYKITFAAWFARRTGDSIDSYNIIAEDGITIVSSSIDGFIITIILSGGTTGETYKITVQIITVLGLAKEVDFTITVIDT